MSTCPHPYDLQSLVDGALGPREERQVNEHLRGCEACAARAQELRRLRELLLERKVSAPEGLLERILELLRTVIPVRSLSCRQALEMASEYIDGELNALECETLEAHLFACEECYFEYVSMRTAAQAMRSAPAIVPSESLKDRILAAVGQEAASPAEVPVVLEHPAWRWRRVLAPAAAIAAVVLLTFGVFMASNGPTSDPTERVAEVSSHPTAPVVADDLTDSSEPEERAADGVEAALELAALEDETDAASEETTADVAKERVIEEPARDEYDAVDVSPRYAEVLREAGRSASPRSSSASRSAARDAGGSQGSAASRPAPATRQPVRVIEPPEIAMAPGTPSHPGAGLRTSERTARTSTGRARVSGSGGGIPAPPMPIDLSAGVVASRPPSGAGGSGGASRPAASEMVAASRPLTRPAERPVIAARPGDERYEDTPESALEHRSMVARLGSSSRTVYSARDNEDAGARLRESSEKINRQINRDRRALETPGVPADQ